MAVDEPAHHLGLARGAERRAGLLRLLHRDEAIDDLAALHQQPVHGLVDAVDLAAADRSATVFRNRDGFAMALLRHIFAAAPIGVAGAALIGGRGQAKSKKTLTAAPRGLSKPVAAA